MSIDRRELNLFLQHLRKIGAIKIDIKKGYRLHLHDEDSDAPRSPIYFDFGAKRSLKPGPLDSYELDLMGKFLWLQVQEEELIFSGVAGVPHGGTALAQTYRAQAYHARGEDIPMLKLKKYGEGGREHVGPVLNKADLPEGMRVLLIENNATKGGRLEEAVEQLRIGGYHVIHALTFLDREQGATENLSKIGVRLYGVVTLKTILEPDTGVLSTDEISAVRSYLKM